MNEQALPIATRWTLYALGAVEGQRVRRPRDPVAAWLLRRNPRLLPAFAAPSVLTMIRARASVVDAMVAEEVHFARRRERKVALCVLGGGFDARWYRMGPLLSHTVASHHEVEDPELLEFKDALLSASSFAPHWKRVHRVAAAEEAWTLPRPGTDQTIAVLEGASTRMGRRALKATLARIREAAPGARVIVDLPGFMGAGPGAARPAAVAAMRTRWASAAASGAAAVTRSEFEALGFRVLDDVWFAARPELRGASGVAMCAGMEAFRVLRLGPHPA